LPTRSPESTCLGYYSRTSPANYAVTVPAELRTGLLGLRPGAPGPRVARVAHALPVRGCRKPRRMGTVAGARVGREATSIEAGRIASNFFTA
jgi:hypothetical protein